MKIKNRKQFLAFILFSILTSANYFMYVYQFRVLEKNDYFSLTATIAFAIFASAAWFTSVEETQ